MQRLLAIIWLLLGVGNAAATITLNNGDITTIAGPISIAETVVDMDGLSSLTISSGTITNSSTTAGFTITDTTADTSGWIEIINSGTISTAAGTFPISIGDTNNNYLVLTNYGTISGGTTGAILLEGSSNLHLITNNAGTIGNITMRESSGNDSTVAAATVVAAGGVVGNISVGTGTYGYITASGGTIGTVSNVTGSPGMTVTATAGSIGNVTYTVGNGIINATGGSIGDIAFVSGTVGTVTVNGGTTGIITFVDGNNSLTISSGTVGALNFGSGNDTLTLSGGTLSGAVDFVTGGGNNTVNINGNISIGQDFTVNPIGNDVINITLGAGTPITITANTLDLSNAAINLSVREDELLNITTGTAVPIIDASAVGATYTNYSLVSRVTATSTPLLQFGTPSIDGNGSLVIPVTAIGVSTLSTEPRNLEVAKILDNLQGTVSGDMATVISEIRSLNSSSQIDAALAQLTPNDNNLSIDGTLFAQNQAIQAIEGRTDLLRVGFKDSTTGYVSSSFGSNQDRGMWLKGFGGHARQDPYRGFAGYNINNVGVAGGIDWDFDHKQGWIGVGLSYAQSQINTKNSPNSKLNIKTYQVTAYSSFTPQEYFIDAFYSLALNCYDSERGISIGGINRNAVANYIGYQTAAKVRAGYNYYDPRYTSIVFSPIVAVQYTGNKEESYEEDGAGSLNLTVTRKYYNQAKASLGARISRTPKGKGHGAIYPALHGFVVIDFTKQPGIASSRFYGGGNTFQTSGLSPQGLGFNIGGSVTVISWERFHLAASYDLDAKEEYIGHSGSINVRLLL